MRAIDWTREGTTTPSKYRFVLSFVLYSENGTLELVHAPLEWQEIELMIKRDDLTHGVYITAVVDTLTFIREGAELLKTLYAARGVFATCNLAIYYLDYTTREYVSMPSTYKLDFNTYRLTKLSKSTNGVQINALPDDTISKFRQRLNTPVNLNNLKGLSGFAITDYTSLKKTITTPEITINKTAVWHDTFAENLTRSTSGAGYAYIPATLNGGSDFTEARSVVYYESESYDRTRGLFVENDTERTIRITGTVNIDINSIVGGTSRITISLLVLNIDNTLSATLDAQSYTEGETGAKTVTIDETYTLPVDKSIILIGVALVDGAGGSAVNVDFLGSDLILTETVETIPAGSVEGMPIYEALNRNLQIILDKQFPLYSEFFGRTDIAYNVGGDLYAAEDQLRFASLLPGICFRGQPLASAQFPAKFIDLFKAVKALYCVGGTFTGTIATGFIFRIEELAYFYQDTEILDLSARVNEVEIEREQYSEAMFASLKSGYSKFDYEDVSGRGEYNTTNERTTPVPNDNSFDNLSPVRGDTRGMMKLLSKPISTTGGEDVAGDSDVFILKTQAGSDWDAETDENITIVGNTSLFQSGSLNLLYTPVRNLVRQGQIIRAGLNYNPGSIIAYQLSEKNNTLETTGEGYTIAENDDITAEDLTAPLWYPELLSIEVPFYEPDFVAIAANPLGYVTLSDTLAGWIMDIKYKFAQNKAIIKLIRKC
jgi:hypothetical protein